MPDIFLSYAPTDRKRAAALEAALEREGFSVNAPAGGAPGAAQAQVDAAAATIVCWSRAGVRSDALFAAAARAYNKNKLISVLVQPAEPPDPYNQVRQIDLSAWRGGEDDAGWRALIGALQAAAPPSAAPPSSPRLPAHEAVETPAEIKSKPANLFKPPTPAEPPSPDDAPLEEPIRFRLVLMTLGAMALAVAVLMAAPPVIQALNHAAGRPHRTMAARDDLPPAPTYPSAATAAASAPAPSSAAPDPDQTAPPASFPVPEVRTPVVTPVGGAAKAADSAADGAAQPANPIQTTTDLETCLGLLARQCPHADPALAADFAVDGKVSVGERRLLGAALFPDRALVTRDNLKACRAALAAHGSGGRAKACAALDAKTEAAAAEPPPGEAEPAAPIAPVATGGAVSP